jgi:hypothetical protein
MENYYIRPSSLPTFQLMLRSCLTFLTPGLGNPVNDNGQNNNGQAGLDAAPGLVFGQANNRLAGTASGTPVQLVRHPHVGAPFTALHLHR